MASQRSRSTNTLGTRLGAIQSTISDLEGRTRTPADDGSEGRLETLERTVELLSSANYRVVQDEGNYRKALLDPAYRGPGPARVKFLPNGELSSDIYQWRGKFEPWGNRTVDMINIGGTWYIQGHAAEEGQGGKTSIQLLSGLLPYNYLINSNQYLEPRAQRTSSGIVVLSGLIGFVTAATLGRVLFTLPEAYRPDRDMLVPVLNSDNGRVLQISANGQVLIPSSNWIVSSNDYLSLDGIAYPAAGVATWTDIGTGGSAFANNWVGHEPLTYGVPGYWKDPYGVVWFRGLIKNGTMTADLAMFTMPTGYGSPGQTHQLIAASNGSTDGTGLVSTFPDGANAGKVTWKGGTIGNAYVSLAGVKNWTADALTINAASIQPIRYSNGWGAYGSGYTQPQAMRREDGLGMAQGLLAVGTGNAMITVIQDWILPEKIMIISTTGADVFRRMDMTGFRSPSGIPGTLTAPGIASAWLSLDRLTWMVGD